MRHSIFKRNRETKEFGRNRADQLDVDLQVLQDDSPCTSGSSGRNVENKGGVQKTGVASFLLKITTEEMLRLWLRMII